MLLLLLVCCRWVTCVACLPDGKVVSGGMDSKMWMWPSGSTRGIQMEGHSSPISKASPAGRWLVNKMLGTLLAGCPSPLCCTPAFAAHFET